MATTSRSYPPGPGTFSWSDWLAVRNDPLNFATQLTRAYGDIVYLKILGSRDIYLLSDPADIQDVLVTHRDHFHDGRSVQAKPLLGKGLFNIEDEDHLRERRFVQPAFHRQRIASYSDLTVEYTRQASQRWEEGATIDLFQEMKQLLFALVDKMLFGIDVEQKAWKIRNEFSAALDMYNRYAALPFAEVFLQLLLPLAEVFFPLPLPGTRRFRRAQSRLDAILFRIIEEHQQSEKDPNDLLALLLLAHDPLGNRDEISIHQLHNELTTLFLSGKESLAAALVWAWYLLSQHSDILAKLQEELDEVLGGRLPSAVDLPRLKYTEMVLAEAMRLYPPVFGMTRRVISEHQVGQYAIPIGATVVVSQYIVHRDPRFYHDPLQFDPERFNQEAKASRPKFAYFPFGGGHKVCLGEPLSWIVGVLVLATLAQSWEFHPVPDHQVKLSSLTTLLPKQGKHGLQMTLVRRQHSPVLQK